MTLKAKLLPFLSATLIISGVSAFAALPSSLVNVNFYLPDSGGPATGIGVVGASGDFWNGFGAASSSTFTLFDTSGQLSSVTLTYSIGSTATSGAGNIQPNGSLMTDYAFSLGDTDITLDIGGLAPNSEYDLYLYVSSNDAIDGSRAVDLISDSSSVSASGDPQTSFISGDNYVLLTPTSDSSGNIHVRETEHGGVNEDGEIDLNGLQLQTIPEPATWSFLAAGGFGLALLAKRNSTRH